MFPSTVFRQAYDRLLQDDLSHASRRYLEILEWAATNSESGMAEALPGRLDAGEDLDFEQLVAAAQNPVEKPIEIEIPAPNLFAYDSLLEEVTV
jgi:hypothetical protein